MLGQPDSSTDPLPARLVILTLPHTLTLTLTNRLTAPQGKGIWLTDRVEDLVDCEAMVAQRYIPNPLLVDGYKFDLRIYALVTSVAPLRVMLYKDGLMRLCTEKYKVRLPHQPWL